MFLLSSTDFFFKKIFQEHYSLFYILAYPQYIGHFLIFFVALTNAVLVDILHITTIPSFVNFSYKPSALFIFGT